MKEPTRTSFVEFVDRYTDLKWKGTCWMGCCPIHDETSPSFAIYPNKGDGTEKWVCFACSPQASNPSSLIAKLDPSFEYDSITSTVIKNIISSRIESNEQTSYSFLIAKIKTLRETHSFNEVEEFCMELDDAMKRGDTNKVNYLLTL